MHALDHGMSTELLLSKLPHCFIEKVKAAVCKSLVDVGFILDSSGSVKNDYPTLKGFLKSLAAAFQLNDDGPIAGVVTFSKDAELSIKLNDHSMHNVASFNEAVDNIPYMGSITRLDKALELAQSDLFSVANGDRPGVPNVLIALVDGTQTDDPGARDPVLLAQSLRNDGITPFFVGIGPEMPRSYLLELAGNNESFIFTAPAFDDLNEESFVNAVIERTCPGM